MSQAKSGPALARLKTAFEKMKDPKYVRTPEKLRDIVALGKDASIDQGVIEQTYRTTQIGSQKLRSEVLKEERFNRRIDDEQYIPEPYRYDDISSAGHLSLEIIREERKYNRAAAYELPLLVQYREKYVKPNAQQFLKFTYAQTPSETEIEVPEVVLSFDPTDIPDLSAPQLHKFCLLAAEYMQDGVVTLKCKSFKASAQNKQYLLTLYRRLLICAKEEDAFDDVPLPLQCTKPLKPKSVYPTHVWPAKWNRPDLKPRVKDDLFSVVRVETL